MLTHLDIAAFRGVKSGALAELRPLTLLTGGNGSGKSTALDALHLAAAPDPARALAEQLAASRLGGAARFLIPAGEPGATCKLRARTEAEARALAFAVRPVAEADGPPPHARIDLQVRGGELSAVGSVHTAGDNRAAVAWKGEPPALIPSVTRVSPAADLARAWSDATLAGHAPAVIERLRRVAPGVRDVQLVLDRAGAPLLYALGDASTVPLDLLGAGVIAWLRLALALLAAPAGLLLVDEPARHAHPSTTWEIGRLLWDLVADGRQVVLATQSLDLVDAVVGTASRAQNEQIGLRRLVLIDGALKVGALDGDDVAFTRNLVQEDPR